MPGLFLTQIYESDNMKVEADDRLALARTEWLRPLNDEDFVAEAMTAYRLILDRNAELVLVNSKQVSILSPATKDWLSNTYYNLLCDSSLKKMARVMPDNLFKKLALASVVARADAAGNLTYKIKDFASEEEALNWLLGN